MEKKNLRYYLLAVILLAAVFLALTMTVPLFSNHKSENGTADEGESPAPEVSLPYIIIDPGHGGRDRGASGAQTGTPEDVLNLDVARRLKVILESAGFRVDLTRSDDNALAPSKKEDMRIRRRIMHESGADLTVSIHMNKFSDSAVKGPMVFYTAGDENSEQLAVCIMQSLCEGLGLPARRVNTGDYYVIRDSSIPAVIVECGFLSNPQEEKLLCTEEYRATLARCIATGIVRWQTEK